jgi:hypothetical protein
MTRKEIMDMIWEVDEDLDDMISWSEFEAMYVRRKIESVRRKIESDIYRERDCVCLYRVHCVAYNIHAIRFLIEPPPRPPPHLPPPLLPPFSSYSFPRFARNLVDRSGLEMFKLYNVAQFMLYDKKCNGTVNVDETMSMLYARYVYDPPLGSAVFFYIVHHRFLGG